MNNSSEDVYEGFDLSKDEVEHFKNNHPGLCNVDLSRVSQFLLIQLAAIQKHRIYNSFAITEVIQELEGVGRGCQQRIESFKYLPLKGLWKAHFHHASFIVKNIYNHWGLGFENSPKFNSLFERVTFEEERSPSNLGWPGRLAHEMVIGAYKERTDRKGLAGLTGEWIIFAKYRHQNYYLCISRHTSGQEDHELFDFVKLLFEHEYPFLLEEVSRRD
ncbi:hypothetical protein [Methylomonas fluvii]|uniref:Uncharacterized protein n=1 Tax=Methylomonas fluvii TaxID=1854564 RepID=A0ABR9D7G8_9GAMM|nr:hypothetical protein [Methylomonas fluvii]MBD9359053.1 hypothetical protein [Methylomonas fluvii]